LLDRQGRLVALSEVALPTNAIRKQMQLILTLYAGSVVLLALGSSLASAALTRRIIQPLRDLSAAAEQIGNGNLDHPIPMQSGWLELDHLATRLDHSRQQLLSQFEHALLETRRFALLLNAVPAGIATLDESGAITWLNPEAEQLLGYSLASAVRRPYAEIFTPAPGAELTLASLLAKREDTTIACRLKLLDAKQRPTTLAMTTAWLEGDPESQLRRGWVLVMRAVNEDEAIERARSRYLANLAHEFRTPLSSILASTELLADELADSDNVEAASLANAARLSALHLQALVNNILESAKIEAGAFQLRCRRVVVQEVMQQAAQIMTPLLQRRAQWLEIDAPPEPIAVWADPDRLDQVFVNLISNASKYGPQRAAIGIALSIEETRLLVSVSDCGPGFPAGQTFNSFSRLFAPGESPGSTQGMGLGLPIVKAIVQAHGGQVGAENRPAGGARVWFSLPLTEQPPPPRNPAPLAERDVAE
jgi:signal transduction histidine kinase